MHLDIGQYSSCFYCQSPWRHLYTARTMIQSPDMLATEKLRPWARACERESEFDLTMTQVKMTAAFQGRSWKKNKK